MNTLFSYFLKFKSILFFLSRIYAVYAQESFANLNSSKESHPQVVFMVSISDFQKNCDGTLAPDKLNFWINEVNSLDLKSCLVISPFSKGSRRIVSRQVLSIEHYLLNSPNFFLGTKNLLSSIVTWWVSDKQFKVPFFVYFERLIWENYLKANKPKIVLGIGLSNHLLDVCFSHSVKTIEVQHGIFSAEDFRGWWQAKSSDGRNGPNLFIAWDEHYANVVREANLDSVVLGYPHEFDGLDMSRELNYSSHNNDSITVVFSLTCRHLGSLDPWGMIDKVSDLLVHQLLKHKVCIVLRIHPVLQRNAMRRFRIRKWLMKRYEGVQIIFPGNESILCTLRRANIHFTIASSTVMEASYLGVPSLIIPAEFSSSHRYFSLSRERALPSALLNLGIVKVTSLGSVVQDVEDTLHSEKKIYPNPLDPRKFHEVILQWI